MKKCPSCGLVFPDEITFCFLGGDTLEACADALEGTTIEGRFRLDKRIAKTPWASTYEAHHRLIARDCVIKVLSAPLGETERAAFDHVLAVARRTSHDNVAEVMGGGILADGRPFIARENVPGTQPLAATLARGRLSPTLALALGKQILAAVGRIHDFGGVHGNLRPSNMMLDRRGHLVVVDLGFGRSLVRDPWDDDPQSIRAQRYLAPELSSSARSSASADLYAAGVVIYQMLVGKPLYEADDVTALRQLVNDAKLDLKRDLGHVPAPIRAWLGRLFNRIPSYRPANAHHALEDLAEACEEGKLQPDASPGAAAQSGELTLERGFQRWRRFHEIFDKMIQTGHPNGAPDGIRTTFEAISERVEALEEVAKKAQYEHSMLEDILKRAREGRARIAAQMDELNASAKDVRKELQPLRIAAERHGEKAEKFPDQARELHKQVLQWEGRSGFKEPYKELADAYREMADIIESWWSVRSAQLTCERDAEEKEESIRVVDEQLDELRQALGVHESNLGDELKSAEEALGKLGNEADRLELELLDLAGRFCAPLRSKPELGSCFRELAQST